MVFLDVALSSNGHLLRLWCEVTVWKSYCVLWPSNRRTPATVALGSLLSQWDVMLICSRRRMLCGIRKHFSLAWFQPVVTVVVSACSVFVVVSAGGVDQVPSGVCPGHLACWNLLFLGEPQTTVSRRLLLVDAFRQSVIIEYNWKHNFVGWIVSTSHPPRGALR